jgi:hypothetical protein
VFAVQLSIHGGAIFVMERQAKAIVRIIKSMIKKEAHVCRLRAEVEDKFRKMFDKRMSRTIWDHPDCKSSWRSGKGLERIYFPGKSCEYWWGLRKLKLSKFELLY